MFQGQRIRAATKLSEVLSKLENKNGSSPICTTRFCANQVSLKTSGIGAEGNNA
jgi:hypothetical protein